jgi:hypothetical protein
MRNEKKIILEFIKIILTLFGQSEEIRDKSQVPQRKKEKTSSKMFGV